MARKDANRPAKMKAAERRVEVFNRLKLGMSYRAIGQQLGVSEATAHRDAKRVLSKLTKQATETAEEYRQLELAKIDTLYGQAARHIIKDELPDLTAIDRMAKLIDMRAKLLGLYQERIDMTSGGQPIKGYIGISPDDWKGGKDGKDV